MSRISSVAVAAALGATVVLAPAAAYANDVCDAYSGVCVPHVGGTVVNRPPTNVEGTTVVRGGTLPFTGADVALMTVAGVGALAGGTTLLVVARRRRSGTA